MLDIDKFNYSSEIIVNSISKYQELKQTFFLDRRYEWMIQYFRGPYKRIDELTPMHMVLAGGVSGMVSWGLNYPVGIGSLTSLSRNRFRCENEIVALKFRCFNPYFLQVDVVKSRIQIDGMDGPRQYSSSYQCFLKMKSATGWNGRFPVRRNKLGQNQAEHHQVLSFRECRPLSASY